MSVELKNWKELCKEKDERIKELEGKFDLIVERLEEKKNSFHGGTLQENYYWRGVEEAIEIVRKYKNE